MEAEYVRLAVGAFATEKEAEFAKSALEDAGIETWIEADSAGGAGPHVAVGATGYRVTVYSEDALTAEALLHSLAVHR